MQKEQIKILRLKQRVRNVRNDCGAALVMIFLAILMFLYMAILFLDIPYLERVGRSIQRAADAAALAGTVQLTARGAVLATPPFPVNTPDTTRRLQGWIYAKRAAIAILKNSPISGVGVNPFSGISQPATGTPDPLDPVGGPVSFYGYENFNITNGTLVITRGVYERPLNWVGGTQQIFYPIEVGNSATNRVGNNCVATLVGAVLRPTYCDPVFRATLIPAIPPPYPVEDVADSVSVTITIKNIPTLFARILGFPSYTDITRTAVAVPQ